MTAKTFRVGDKVKFNKRKVDDSIPFPAEMGGFGPFVVTEVRPAECPGGRNGSQDIKVNESPRWLNSWWFY